MRLRILAVLLLPLIWVFFFTTIELEGEGVATMLMSFLFFRRPVLGRLSALKGMSGLSWKQRKGKCTEECLSVSSC